MIPRIYIDPGHSSKDPGAVGYEVERDLNEKTSKYMVDHLEKNYVCETKIGDPDENTLSAVVKEANAWDANLFVSNHFNAGGGDGYEALVSSEEKKTLGQIFEKHVKAAGQNSRGVKYRPGLYVLKYTDMPAILNEGAFVDNKKDIEDWNDDAELKKLGEAYAEATAEFLALERKAQKKAEPATGKTVSVALPVLAYGSKGESVKALQILLKARAPKIGTTGNFGSGTQSTLEKVQKDMGIPVTGKTDAGTWKGLLGLDMEEV